MTDKFQQAREATRFYIANRLRGHEKVYGTKMSMAQEDNCCTDFRTGYLAAATASETEIEELRARVAELEGMVPKWVWDAEEFPLRELGWKCVGSKWVGSRTAHYMMPPPIPLPEGEVTK